MMQLNQTQQRILQLLGNGHCHSGNDLGHHLGMSRSAIWKQMNQLIELGVPINRLPHKGYQLKSPLILLDKHYLSELLKHHGFAHPFNVHVFTTVDSTNRYLKDLSISPVLDICCTELQTRGRGRFDRHWHSPFGENIYCSSRWSLHCDLTRLSGLSLISSLAIVATLHELHSVPNIKIKWPNDILWSDKKLCGSLIEIIAESNGNAQIIIGIGLNVNTDTQNHPLPDKPWCSLYEITNQYFDRNLLIARLLINLEQYLDQFMQHGLNYFMDEWKQSDYLIGQHITVTQPTGSISGIAQGVNQLGQLMLQDGQGIIHYLSSGDTSLQQHYSE